MLFEHKSYPDKLVAFQVLRYIVRVWEQVLRDRKNGPFPPVACLVYYHGQQTWNVPLNLGALVDAPAEWQAYVPEFEYTLIDLSAYDASQIKDSVLMQVAILVMKHIFDPELVQKLPEVLDLFNQLQRDQSVIEFLATVLRYIMSASPYVNRAGLAHSMEMVFPQLGGDIVTTLAQELLEQGIEQGIEQGARQELINTIHIGLELKFGADGLAFAPKTVHIQSLSILRSLLTELIKSATLEHFQAAYRQLHDPASSTPEQDDSALSANPNQPE